MKADPSIKAESFELLLLFFLELAHFYLVLSQLIVHLSLNYQFLNEDSFFAFVQHSNDFDLTSKFHKILVMLSHNQRISNILKGNSKP